MHVVIGRSVFYQFTVHDVGTAWTVLELLRRRAARSVAKALRAALRRLPFPVTGIQTDGGSEFKGAFASSCKRQGLAHHVLPPHSPWRNGAVERTNGTARRELYAHLQATWSLSAIKRQVRAFEMVANTVRPHDGLNGRTPAEHLAWLEQCNGVVDRDKT